MKKVLGFLGKALKVLVKPKIFIIVAVITIALGLFLSFGLGLGKGNGAGDEEGDGNSSVKTSQEQADREENNIVKDDENEKEEKQENSDKFDGAIILVSVYENDYFYNNERISLADFIKEIQAIEGNLVVEVHDDNASLRAYENLLDELEEGNINYVEK